MWPLRLQSSFPGRCKNCLRDYRRARSTRETNRRWHLASSYGVTPEWVAEQVAANAGACPVCLVRLRMPEGDGGARRDTAVVDHKGDTVRGVICANCNIGLGTFKDDLETLRRAIAYLERPLVPAPRPAPSLRDEAVRDEALARILGEP